MSLTLVLVSAGLLLVSGLPALMRGPVGDRASATLFVAGSVTGCAGAAVALMGETVATLQMGWHLPGALFVLRLDALSAAFLLPTCVVGAAASVFGLGYWPSAVERSGGRLRLFMGLLAAAMVTVVIAWNGFVFLVAWEVMALAAYFLIIIDDRDAETRRAGWFYLIATHTGTMALIALFVTMRAISGSFTFAPIVVAGGLWSSTSVIVVLAIVGFGFKAGIVPLHFWLPAAHANAPSHVSAVLSGAMLNVGVYGIVRILLLMTPPPSWSGVLLVTLGVVGGGAGILLALGQGDLKRALAYSSVENIGLITIAIGVAILGKASHDAMQYSLGLAAAIAHVWNHSLFKCALFLSAGSVVHATSTRRIGAMGGLGKRTPWTAGAFLVGAASASGLPGGNAFVSEAILYLALFSALQAGNAIGMAAAGVAMIGAITVAVFVRLYGIIFLGEPRSSAVERAHESPASMRLTIVAVAASCAAIGLWPRLLLVPLSVVSGGAASLAETLDPMGKVVRAGVLAAAVLGGILTVVCRRARVGPTWDCGYAAPTPRMQYTGGAVGEWLSERLAPQFLRPASAGAAGLERLFPADSSFDVMIDEPFQDRLFHRIAERWAARLIRLRWVQQGRLPLYLLYIFVTLITGLLWAFIAPLVGMT